MTQRLNYATLSPEPYKLLLANYEYLRGCGLEPNLVNLVFLRVSQINGCAYCVDKHSRDLRTEGETEQRIFCLPVWRECPFYTDRERAALAWAESVTTPADGVPDALFEATRQHFTDKELADLNFAVILMNGLNRLGVPFRLTPAEAKK